MTQEKDKIHKNRIRYSLIVCCFIAAFAVLKLFSIKSCTISEAPSPLADTVSSEVSADNNGYDSTSHVVEKTDNIHVAGNRVYDKKGNEIRFVGIGVADFALYNNTWHGSNWYDWYNTDSLNTIKSWGANTFRAAITVETFENNRFCVEDYKHFTDVSLNCGLYTIVEWGLCGNPLEHIDSARAFFSELSSYYGDNEMVIYEICNEPFHATWDEIYSYANDIIPLIRRNSPNSIIIVSGPYKEGKTQSDSFASIVEKPLRFDNIMYSTHIYTGDNLFKSNLDEVVEVLNAGYAVDISEWCGTMANGTDGFYDISASVYADFLRQYDLSWQYFNMSDFSIKASLQYPYSSSIVNYGMWDNNLPEDCLSESGIFFKNLLQSYSKNERIQDYCMITQKIDNEYFWEPKYANSIRHIYFESAEYKPHEAIASWDVSFVKDSGEVMAYLENNAGCISLHIVPHNGMVYASQSFGWWFAGFSSLEKVFFDNLNFEATVEAPYLFAYDGELTEITITDMNAPFLHDMSNMFYKSPKVESVYLMNNDIFKDVNLYNLFDNDKGAIYVANQNELEVYEKYGYNVKIATETR